MKLENKLPMMVLDGLIREGYNKDTFWASETETPLYEIMHRWYSVPVTNKRDLFTAWRLELGNATEQAILAGLKDEIKEPQKINDLVDWSEAKQQFYFRTMMNGIPVSGSMDAILKDGSPLEVKSYYGYFQTKEILAGKPRLSYLKQLAIYMSMLNQDTGYLYYAPLVEQGDTLEKKPHKVFKLERKGTTFICGDIEFTLQGTLARWELAYELIKEKAMPDPFMDGVYYKTPVKEIDWKEVSKGDISKARNGHKVLGDWQIQYSDWKDKWIKQQNETIGYTDEEIEFIKEATKGYSKW